MGSELVKCQGSPGRDEGPSPALPCLIPLTWEEIVGPVHTGDARLGSAFKVAAEPSVLWRVEEEAAVFAVDPGREDGDIYRSAISDHISCHMANSYPCPERFRDFLKSHSTERQKGQVWLYLLHFCPTVWPAYIVCPSPNKLNDTL